MRRRVTFSRNLTLSLSRTCRCYCKYCAFATHQSHLHDPDDVLQILDRAVSRHRAKELLVLTGEKPEHNAGVAARLEALRLRRLHRLRGVGVRARARARAAPAHQPGGSQRRGPGAAAGGDRLAGADAGVGLRAADGHRPRRLADQASGAADGDDRRRRRAEGPVHQRDPRRHRRDRGGADGLAGGAGGAAGRARAPAGGHPPELRPPPELLRAGAGRHRRGGRRRVLAHRGRHRAGAGTRRSGPVR